MDTGDGCTVKSLCNAFLTRKRDKLDSEELSPRSFEDYYGACELLIAHVGRDRRVDDLSSDDFTRMRKAMAKKWGPVKLRNEITRIRMIFKFAFDERMIDRPFHFGQSFAPPSAKTLRKARNEAGPRMFKADELRRILDAADPVVRAMGMLGVNGGLGNMDVATLPQSAVDLANGWIDFPRPKTEIHRHIPLWPETITTLREAMARRPNPKNEADADLCFLTIRGTRWLRIESHRTVENRYSRHDQISMRFRGLLKKLGINGRCGLGFYTLRHVFETVADESRDQVAVNTIMGHVDSLMAAAYRERISDERLRAEVETVHGWLFGE